MKLQIPVMNFINLCFKLPRIGWYFFHGINPIKVTSLDKNPIDDLQHSTENSEALILKQLWVLFLCD